MAKLVYALTGQGTWDVHRAGCADVIRAKAQRHYAETPNEFDADTEAQARRIVCDEECQELGYDPDIHVTVFPCATKVLAATPSGTAGKRITIGYTRTDRPGDYVPAVDGYRPGAAQDVRTIIVHTDLVADALAWAEVVFMVTNAPPMLANGLVAAVVPALEASPGEWRSLSVGDTVSVGSTTLACTAVNWEVVPGGHDCLAVDDLEFVADYGASGVGQSWRCRGCGRSWAKVGDRLHRPQDGAHLLRPEDVV